MSASAISGSVAGKTSSAFDGQLPPLPYAENALEPHMSERTLFFHHKKHTGTYISKLKALVDDPQSTGLDLDNLSLFEIVSVAATALRKGEKGKVQAVFNNAAQSWNHILYFQNMKPGGGGRPAEDSLLFQQICQDFGSFENFRDSLKDVSVSEFGSGWSWLVWDNQERKLKVMSTHDADVPFAHEGGYLVPLLACDLWEHAYYLDWQNERGEYVSTFLDHLVNWDFPIKEFAATQGQTRSYEK